MCRFFKNLFWKKKDSTPLDDDSHKVMTDNTSGEDMQMDHDAQSMVDVAVLEQGLSRSVNDKETVGSCEKDISVDSLPDSPLKANYILGDDLKVEENNDNQNEVKQEREDIDGGCEICQEAEITSTQYQINLENQVPFKDIKSPLKQKIEDTTRKLNTCLRIDSITDLKLLESNSHIYLDIYKDILHCTQSFLNKDGESEVSADDSQDVIQKCCNQWEICKEIIVQQEFYTQEMLSELKQLAQKLEKLKDIDQEYKIWLKKTLCLPRAQKGENYTYLLDEDKLPRKDFLNYEIQWTIDDSTSSGELIYTPNQTGACQVILSLLSKTPYSCELKRELTLEVLADPKTLWKDIPSDQNECFWKSDFCASSSEITHNTSLIVASKRGRSHAHNGTFRDDHYAYKTDLNGWTVLAVADGAGSAKFSRRGSQLACETFVDFFKADGLDALVSLEEKISEIYKNSQLSEEDRKLYEVEAKQLMYKGVLASYMRVRKEVEDLNHQSSQEYPKGGDTISPTLLKHFHTTLVTVVYKYIEGVGYVMLSFGVGDCPASVVVDDEHVSLLNVLDVGEFGGGTRFLTEPAIYDKEKAFMPLSERFQVHIYQDFKYLFLMTDGIYDAKFEVESHLEDPVRWVQFIQDLNQKIDFSSDASLEEKQERLLKWLDFWSVGNHDDRTLLIVFKKD